MTPQRVHQRRRWRRRPATSHGITWCSDWDDFHVSGDTGSSCRQLLRGVSARASHLCRAATRVSALLASTESSIFCPAISCLAILMVRHFHVLHFQSTLNRYLTNVSFCFFLDFRRIHRPILLYLSACIAVTGCRIFRWIARSSIWWRAFRSTESSTWFTEDYWRAKTSSDEEWVSEYSGPSTAVHGRPTNQLGL